MSISYPIPVPDAGLAEASAAWSPSSNSSADPGGADYYWLGGRGLQQPLQAHVEWTGDGVLVLERTTGVYGFGGRLADAILDLRAALSEHLDVLDSSAELSDDLQGQARFLRRHLARN